MKKLYSLFLILAITFAGNAQVVISQVYGGGGNSGATYTNDYVELFNRGNAPVTLDGAFIQYASATGIFSNKHVIPTVTIQPGQYYLIQEAGGANGVALPTPDATGTLNFATANGKVALTTNNTAPTSATDTNVLDYVAFGTGTPFEGSVGAAPAPSNTTAIFRANNGCTDSNNNKADFATGTPTPRNTASPTNTCTAPSLSTTPASVDFGNVTISTASAVQTVTVNASNLTTAPTYTVTGTDAAMFNATGTLATTGGTINVTFTPTSTGAKTATLTVTEGTLSSTVALSGTGVSAANPYGLDSSNPVTALNEDFQAGTTIPSGWTTVSDTGDRNWEVKTFTSNNYAQMTAHNGTGVYKTLLISPAIDLDVTQKDKVTFDWNSGYANGATLDVYIIQFVNGSMVKTKLTSINDTANTTGYGTAFTTVNLDLSSYSGIGFLAFEYNGEAGVATTTYQVDNIVALSSTQAVNDVNASKLKFIKNTLVDNTIEFSAKANVKIYNVNGQMVKEAAVNNGTRLDVSNLAKGMYIVAGEVDGQAATAKIIKK